MDHTEEELSASDHEASSGAPVCFGDASFANVAPFLTSQRNRTSRVPKGKGKLKHGKTSLSLTMGDLVEPRRVISTPSKGGKFRNLPDLSYVITNKENLKDFVEPMHGISEFESIVPKNVSAKQGTRVSNVVNHESSTDFRNQCSENSANTENENSENDSNNQEIRGETIVDQVDHSLDVLLNVITSGILNKENQDRKVSSVRPKNSESNKGVQNVFEASSGDNQNEDEPSSATDTAKDNIPISKLNQRKMKSAKGVGANSSKPRDVRKESDFDWYNVETDPSISENDDNNTLRSQDNLSVKPGNKRSSSVSSDLIKY